MSVHTESVILGGREVSFETGAIARQASGAVLLREGDTVLLAVVSAAKSASAISYMPLMTDYRQKLAAAGKIPGGYGKREGRANELETLISRLVDRSIRPFFPDAWRCDTQVLISPLSYDPDCDLPVLAIAAASAALNLSDVPWSVPLAGVRVTQGPGQAEPEAFPDAAARERASLDFVVSVSPEGVVMLEGGAREASEAEVIAALNLAQAEAAPLQAALERLRAAAGKPKRPAPEAPAPAPALSALEAGLRERAQERLASALQISAKLQRYEACDALVGELMDWAQGEVPDQGSAARDYARAVFDALKKEQIRAGICAGRRLGGRRPDEIREITGRAGWLPRTHGSALFTRGETQALVTCTLAGLNETQRLETVGGEVRQRLMLHYNFPSYSVGEVRPDRGPGRREIGHGHLARRALLGVLPGPAEFPYTIRIESTITESNGSSSMASVCGGSLSLCDAGVPLPRPVAGIAMGLVREGGQTVVLSDILGDEDHVGDMDFKVAGTREGITAIQLDNKLGALPHEVMVQALEQAKAGRIHILGEMDKVLQGPRSGLSAHAPKVETVQIEPQRIRSLIGTGGATINGIRRELSVEIDIAEDGLVTVYGVSPESLEAAKERIRDLTGLPVLGQSIRGRVTGVKHFGSFVRLYEGIEGLLHGEQLRMGGEVDVKVIGVTNDGKLEIARA